MRQVLLIFLAFIALPAIAFGSHIDSVPNGGNYNGQAGVMAAMEMMSMPATPALPPATR